MSQPITSFDWKTWLAGLLGLTVTGWWLTQPDLSQLAPQLFLVMIVGYLLSRKFLNHTPDPGLLFLWPNNQTWQLGWLVAAVGLLVGATGGLASALIWLVFGLLFVIVLTSSTLFSLVISLGLASLLLVLTPDNTSELAVWGWAASLPVASGLFGLAKAQFGAAWTKTTQALKDDDWAETRQDSTGWFVSKLLLPKLSQIQESIPATTLDQAEQTKLLAELHQLQTRAEHLLTRYQLTQSTNEDLDASPTKSE